MRSFPFDFTYLCSSSTPDTYRPGGSSQSFTKVRSVSSLFHAAKVTNINKQLHPPLPFNRDVGVPLRATTHPPMLAITSLHLSLPRSPRLPFSEPRHLRCCVTFGWRWWLASVHLSVSQHLPFPDLRLGNDDTTGGA
ncbi:unnamed protein product [Cyclocybe aegerita]|uniref:Uncharacterized protein n=1 Tax=Cyclocybe aegerita TaxID=1973307 RepID=A0A8S0XTS9_CYCAE|nr:unnamed protein product [Cyclocybe aegerita]